MCYSILVETNLTKLERDFRAALDLRSFAEAYRIRAAGYEAIKIPRAIDNYFVTKAAADSPLAATCKQLAEQFMEDQRSVLNAKLDQQQQKIIDLEAKLKARWSKTNDGLLARARRVQAKAQGDVQRLTEPLGLADSQVFQYSYSPVITSHGGRNVVRLMRYQLKPRHAKEDVPSHINMFNARLDALTTRRSWQPLLGKNHGLVLLKGFYEWVPHPETGKSAVIRFFPDDGSTMWVPCLYDRWQGDGYVLDSFAVITGEPPAEIEQQGHDRCPIYPSWQHIDGWLAGGSVAASYDILNSREPVRYQGNFVTKVLQPSSDDTSSQAD